MLTESFGMKLIVGTEVTLDDGLKLVLLATSIRAWYLDTRGSGSTMLLSSARPMVFAPRRSENS